MGHRPCARRAREACRPSWRSRWRPPSVRTRTRTGNRGQRSDRRRSCRALGIEAVPTMKKETVRTFTIVVGLVILLAVLGLGSAVWLFTQAIERGKADEVVAGQEFD